MLQRYFLTSIQNKDPYPPSLIYDLFGEINKDDKNIPIVRAKDIASELQNNSLSPYKGLVKFPGQPRGAGFID